jgi:hypothetical protein
MKTTTTTASLTTSSAFRNLFSHHKPDLRNAHIAVLRRLDYEIYYINDRILHRDVTPDYALRKVKMLLQEAKSALEAVGCVQVVLDAFQNPDATVGRSYCYRFKDSSLTFTGKSTPKYVQGIA